MIRSVIALSVCIAAVLSAKCEDGVDNVMKIYDASNGKGKILFDGLELWTYDNDKKPACQGGKASFMLPGHFKVAKGSVHVTTPVKENSQNPLKLSLSVEKQSWLIGVVCENGKSKNQFVPDELCKMDFCKLAGEQICGMIGAKTPGPIDISLFAPKDLIDIGPLPIPQIDGEWKLSAKIMDGKKIIAAIEFGKSGEWHTIGTETSTPGGDFNVEYSEPKASHDEF